MADILPVELWESILSLTSLAEALELSKLCTTFNTICIRWFLARHETSLFDLVQEPTVALTPDTLRALALYSPTTSIPAQKISVDLSMAGAHGFRRPMGNLLQLVERSPHLRELELEFPSFRTRFDPGQPLASTDAMRLMCAALALASGRNSGPVLVCTLDWRRAAFTCNPRDIAAWDLSQHKFNPPKDPLESEVEPNLPSWMLSHGPLTTTTCHDGTLVRFPVLDSMETLRLRLDDSHVGSLLILDEARVSHLRTRHQHAVPSLENWWHIFLRNARMPGCRELVLPDAPDLPSLRCFLENHPAITRLEYISELPNRSVDEFTPPPLIDPPLGHPGLRDIEIESHDDDRNGLVHAVLAGLIESSPNIQIISFFGFDLGASANDATGLMSELRSLTTRPGNILTPLKICFIVSWVPGDTIAHGPAAGGRKMVVPESDTAVPSNDFNGSWANSEAGLSIARSLDCVGSVSIRTADVSLMRSMFPWIAALPAATEALFQLNVRSWKRRVAKARGRTTAATFDKEAKEAFAELGVPQMKHDKNTGPLPGLGRTTRTLLYPPTLMSAPPQKQLLFAADALFLDLASNAPTKVLLTHFSSTEKELVIQHAPIICPYPLKGRLTGLNAVRSYFDLISLHWDRADLCVESQIAVVHPTRTVTIRGSVRWIWKVSRNEWVEKFTCVLEYDENFKVVGMVVETTSSPGTCVMRAVDSGPNAAAGTGSGTAGRIAGTRQPSLAGSPQLPLSMDMGSTGILPMEMFNMSPIAMDS
ncbi:hypothetical protein HMN09_00990400 [Mycena chlorophos]|uniref:F-box domain-containing protein n=1 Tax=Mycena chlorophos TaxID=658473 RepID=A0A8H6SJA9_MYCCL|nr:hypothetical protein HMN09_00990400 [Mycena chlorophos]